MPLQQVLPPIEQQVRVQLSRPYPVLRAPEIRVSQKTFLDAVRAGNVTRVELPSRGNKVLFLTNDNTIEEAAVMLSPDVLGDVNHSASDVVVDDVPRAMDIILQALPWLLIAGSFFVARGARFERKAAQPIKISGVSFSQVAGIDDVKEEVVEIIDFLKSPDKYEKVGARIPKGCLLTGPPGVGKTLLAKAMACEAGVPFFACAGSDFVEIFAGMGAANIRELFQRARKAAPCILYIDEIDAVGKKRSVGSNNEEREQTLNQLLVELDGMLSRERVIVLASTNRIDVLDEALLRPGRFDRKIEMSNPTEKQRRAILRSHMVSRPVDRVDVDMLSKLTAGFSGAELANLVNEAAIIAARENSEKVVDKHFQAALDRLVLGIAGEMPAEKQQWITTVHECGHVMASIYLTTVYDSLLKVTVEPRGRAGGVTVFLPNEDVGTRQYYLERISVLLGGRAAEEVLLGKHMVTTGAFHDIEVATNTARAMVQDFGFCDDLGIVKWNLSEASESTSEKMDRSVSRIIEDRYQMVVAMMKSKVIILDKLAHELLAEKVMTAEHVRLFLRNLGEDV